MVLRVRKGPWCPTRPQGNAESEARVPARAASVTVNHWEQDPQAERGGECAQFSGLEGLGVPGWDRGNRRPRCLDVSKGARQRPLVTS